MPFVSRDPQGHIDSLHRQAQSPAQEFLDDQHPEVQAFVGHRPETSANNEFGQLDADFVRVIEDVIDTLITKNIINITDLPAEAQAKLFARKSFRERLPQSALRLFEPSPLGHDTI